MKYFSRLNKLLILFFTSLISIVYSQKYNFKNFTIENGLPQSYVQSIIQDKEGYMWIGTGDGLCKYDGANFKIFTKRDGLSENHITSSVMDKDGNLWFGHPSGNISFYSNSEKLFKRNHSLQNTNFKSQIHNLYIDPKGKLYVATLGNGLYVIENKKIINYTDETDSIGNLIFSVIEDSNQNIWVGTNKGTYTIKDGHFQKLNLPQHVGYALLEDKNKNIWIATNRSGLIFISSNILQKTSSTEFQNIHQTLSIEQGLALRTVFSLKEDSKGNIWAGTYDGGISKITTDKTLTNYSISNYIATNGLPNQIIYDIAEDREGNIWIGTLGGACVIRYNDEEFETYTTAHKLSSNQISSILKTENTLWIGTELGINKVSIFKNQIQKVDVFNNENGLKQDQVLCIHRDNDNNIWCGTRGGIAFLRPNTKKFISLDITTKRVSTITQDQQNNLWIGADDGAYKYNLTTKKVERYSTENILKSNIINKIIIDSKKNVWIATAGGLTCIKDGGNVIAYNKASGIKHDNIYCITEDITGHIWFGTQEGGIYKYNYKDNSFKNYTTVDGLSSDNPYSIICDNDNNIWIGTSSGIDKFNQQTNSFTHYGKEDGFLGIETNLNSVYKDDDGKLWFGTVNGLVKYNPEKEIRNHIEPLTHITGIKIFLKDTLNLGTEKISYKQNHLTFNYIGISLSFPEKVRYQYKLAGFDSDWSPVTSKNEVTYSNIPHGEYTFMVKASNNDGIWNKEPAQYHFIITPPFWKTKWFIVLCSLLSLGSIYSFIKLRTRALEKAKERLAFQVKERTIEVVQQKQEIEQKNKDITDSINYAQRIQRAILPLKQDIQNRFRDSFIFYRPRDIVSGDLYWHSAQNGKSLLAVVDCTGHGVPGAFMSIVANSSLNEIINEGGITEPDKILNKLDDKITNTLKQSSEEAETRDGMDVALCTFDFNRKELNFSGANRPMYIIRNKELIKTRGNNFPVGSYHDKAKKFTTHTFQLEKGDCIYIFSDGFSDQFGGPQGKKFMTKQFDRLLLSIHDIPMHEQEKRLKMALADWQGTLESVDDILVIGLRF